MGVTVHQSGNDESAGRVDCFDATILLRQCSAAPDPADRVTLPDYRCIGHRVDIALATLGSAGGELADVGEEFHLGYRLSVIGGEC